MQAYINFAVEQMKALCAIPSPSGYTIKVTEYLMNLLREIGYEAKRTNKGSVLVTLGGEGEHLVLAAHIDTLGAMVRAVKSNGRLRLTTIGGYPFQNIENENVTIHTRKGKEYSATVHLCEPAAHVNKDISTEQLENK